MKLQKVGQYPSHADLNAKEYSKFRKHFPTDAAELTRAVGLFGHGIGIGAFVYLRRTFERIISRAAAKASIEDSDLAFYSLRMDEKIEKLREWLPSFVSDAKVLYKILSAGLHQLEEEKCKAYFPAVLNTVTMMLEDELSDFERQRRRKDNLNMLAKIKADADGP